MAGNKKDIFFGISSLALYAGIVGTAVLTLPTERHQGEVYRIIYLHVPSAFTAFFCAAMLMFHSIRNLIKPDEVRLTRSRSWAETGILFTILTLLRFKYLMRQHFFRVFQVALPILSISSLKLRLPDEGFCTKF